MGQGPGDGDGHPCSPWGALRGGGGSSKAEGILGDPHGHWWLSGRVPDPAARVGPFPGRG